MTDQKQIITTLLSRFFSNGHPDDSLFDGLTNDDWKEIYSLSVRQGIAAMAYDAVEALPEAKKPGKEMQVLWAATLENRRGRYERNLMMAEELCGMWANRGISAMVIRGASLAQYYPVPEYRESGDFDCYLLGDYKRGNVVAEEIGAVVIEMDEGYSLIRYKDLVVKNHIALVRDRREDRMLMLDECLNRCLDTSRMEYLNEKSMILNPGAEFNARYIVYNNYRLLMSYGISLRHICDWAMFLRSEGANVDWEKFGKFCEEFGFVKFVGAMTDVAVRYMGVDAGGAPVDGEFSDTMMESIMRYDPGVYSRLKTRRQRRRYVRKRRRGEKWVEEMV